MTKLLGMLTLVLSLGLVGFAQTNQENPLVPGQRVEREIAGGQSHTYQITLESGQFMRVLVAQKEIDLAVVLTDPEGKQIKELSIPLGTTVPESIFVVSASSGDYRLTVRTLAVTSGTYKLQAEVRAAATAQDEQRVTATEMLAKVAQLNRKGAATVQEAVETAQQALNLWRALGDQLGQAKALYLIGNAYDSEKKYDQAKSHYEQSLRLYREIGNRAGEASVLLNFGSASHLQRQYEQAASYYDQALAIYRAIKDRSGEGSTLLSLGQTYTGLHQYAKAIAYQEEALATYREIKNVLGEGNALTNLGTSYKEGGQRDKAIEYHKQALAAYRAVKDRRGESVALNNLGSASFLINEYERSVEYYEQALVIHRERKNRAWEGVTLGNLASAYQFLYQFEKALETYEQSLTLHREFKDRVSEGRVLNSVGAVYALLNRYEKAIEYYEQALPIAREVRQRALEGTLLNNIGYAYGQLGQDQKAIQYHEQALSIRREVHRSGEGETLMHLGILLSKLNQPEKAIEYYERSLPIHLEVSDRAAEASALSNLGSEYYKIGNNKKATECFERALGITREVKDRAEELAVLRQFADFESARGNLVQARTLVEEALRIAESFRAENVSPESRAAFFSGNQKSYQTYTDVLMRQHKQEPTKGLDALAVEVSERQRARSLLDLLSESGADLRQGVDLTLLERERVLGRQLNEKAQALAQATKPEQLATLNQEVSQLETDLERAQAAIRKASPRYAALTQPQPLKLKEIQQQLDADTLLLEYALGEERSYLWAITKDSLTSYELPKEGQINQSALAVYELLTARSTNTRGESALKRRERIAQAEARLPTAAGELSQTLLAPVAQQLGNKRLIIVADGALQYIPFAMLPEPKDEGGRLEDERRKRRGLHPSSFIPQPLIVSHEVVSLSSASALAIQRTELEGRQPAPKMLAVIADPVFDRTDVRFTTPETQTSAKAQTRTIAFADERSIEHLAEKSHDKSGATTRQTVNSSFTIHATRSDTTARSRA